MSTFVAQHVTRSHTIHIPAPCAAVFPLFSPLGERHWEPDWRPTMLYPASGEAQNGTVFTTQHEDEPPTVWTIVAYDAQRLSLSYVNVAPSSRLTRIDISCAATGPAMTSASITYTLTALTAQGNAYLDRFTDAHYREYIASWGTAINSYLAHGQPPAPHRA